MMTSVKCCFYCEHWKGNGRMHQQVPAAWGICQLPYEGLPKSPILLVLNPELAYASSTNEVKPTTALHTRNDFSCAGFEPIVAPGVVSAIYFDGVLQTPSGYSVDPTSGFVTFIEPPPTGRLITADFTYYFLVRFADDTTEFENFMYRLWSVKQIKLQSVLL